MRADTLLTGACVVTMDPERRVIENGAVAVAGGVIVAVGERGAIEAMRSRGLRYPDDFAIAGFNNTQISRVLALPLTTIQYPIEQVSRHAGELVRRLIENPAADVESKTFAPSLIVRAST